MFFCIFHLLFVRAFLCTKVSEINRRWLQ